MRLSHLTALAVMIALVGAMFVAVAPAAAATYYCMNTAAEGETAVLKVTNKAKTIGYILTEGPGADAGDVDRAAGDDLEARLTAANDCPTTAGRVAADGDALEVLVDDQDDEDDTNDTAVWQRVYEEATGAADSETTLYLDDPNNPKAGPSDAARPQSATVARTGPTDELTTYSPDPQSGVPEIVTVDVADAAFTFTAAKAGTVTITFEHPAAGGRAAYDEVVEFTVLAATATPEVSETTDPSLKITFLADSDNVFGAGSSVAVRVTAENVSVNSLSVSGGLDFYEVSRTTTFDTEEDPPVPVKSTATARNPVVVRTVIGSTVYDDDDLTIAMNGDYDDKDTVSEDGETTTKQLFIAVPAGTSDGDYVVTVNGTYTRAGRTHSLTETKTLTIGDVGEVDTVELALSSPRLVTASDEDEEGGGAKGDQPDGYADDSSTREPSIITVGATNSTELSLQIRNTNGKPSEASAISSIVVSTTNGTLDAQVKQSAAGAADILYECDTISRMRSCEVEIEDYVNAGNPVPANIRLVLSAAEKPGNATVTAYVIDTNGQHHPSNEVVVTFAGEPEELSVVGGLSNVLAYDRQRDGGEEGALDELVNDKRMDKRDQVIFLVSATDTVGQQVVTPTLNIDVKDPEGKNVSSDHYETIQFGLPGDRYNTGLMLTVEKARSTKLDAGVYEITLTSKDDSSVSVDGNFTVVHWSDSVELELSTTELTERGQQVVVTANVTSGGEAVADGTVVTFQAPDVTGDRDSVLVAISDTSPETKGGKA
ncbi:MAG: hypothetical protein OXC29_14495, partial [Rhodococcus sp.]|nr:hypothetical protein [Rhodococcus sp. (in: high G+C Gram-positive bacteria)]